MPFLSNFFNILAAFPLTRYDSAKNICKISEHESVSLADTVQPGQPPEGRGGRELVTVTSGQSRPETLRSSFQYSSEICEFTVG